MNLDALAVQERITAYLASGGLFNPECANHDAVRDLLIDARAALAQVRDEALEEAAKEADKWATLEQRNHGNGGPSAAIRAMKEVNK